MWAGLRESCIWLPQRVCQQGKLSKVDHADSWFCLYQHGNLTMATTTFLRCEKKSSNPTTDLLNPFQKYMFLFPRPNTKIRDSRCSIMHTPSSSHFVRRAIIRLLSAAYIVRGRFSMLSRFRPRLDNGHWI